MQGWAKTPLHAKVPSGHFRKAAQCRHACRPEILSPAPPSQSIRYTCDEKGDVVPTRMWQFEMDAEAHPYKGEQTPPKVDQK